MLPLEPFLLKNEAAITKGSSFRTMNIQTGQSTYYSEPMALEFQARTNVLSWIYDFSVSILTFFREALKGNFWAFYFDMNFVVVCLMVLF